jgi:hypothetical protein
MLKGDTSAEKVKPSPSPQPSSTMGC